RDRRVPRATLPSVSERARGACRSPERRPPCRRGPYRNTSRRSKPALPEPGGLAPDPVAADGLQSDHRSVIGEDGRPSSARGATRRLPETSKRAALPDGTKNRQKAKLVRRAW